MSEPPLAEVRFAAILADAAKVYKDKTRDSLDDFMNPPLATVQDLKTQLSIYNDNFSAFRAKRQRVFDAVVAALKPIELFGGIAAGAASTAYPPAQTIHAAALFLVNSAHNVSGTYDSVIELFDQLKGFTSRLDVYLKHQISPALRAHVVAILASLFEVLVLATKEIRRGRFRAYFKRVIGSESPVQPALEKLKALALTEERQVLADTFGNISELSTKADDLEIAVSQVNQGVQSLRVEHREISSLPHKDKLRQILGPTPFPEDIYNAFKKSTVPHTGDWILEDEGLAAWLRAEVPYLWIVGNAGTGKSYLTARIITWALENTETLPFVGYFFFRANNSETRSVLQAIRDVAHQLSEKDAAYRRHLLAQLQSRDEIKTVASAYRELIQLASPAADDQGPRTYYIFLDGIDEANLDEVSELLANLTPSEDEPRSKWLPRFQFALIGRSWISDQVTGLLDPVSSGQTLATLQVTADRNASDVKAFIASSVFHSRVLGRTSGEFKKQVIKTLEKQADGLFLVATLMIGEVNRKRHQSSILDSLRTYPKEIDGVLYRTVSSLSGTISDEDARDLNEMLAWVTCAEESLTLGQLEAVLVLTFGDPPLFLEESLRRQYSCFFDLEREDGLTTDDLVKDYERTRRDMGRGLSPAKHLSSQHIRSLSAGEASAPPRRISPAGRGRNRRSLGHFSPIRQPSPVQGTAASDTSSDTEFRSNKSTTRVTFFHATIAEFFRMSRHAHAEAAASETKRLAVGFDIQKAQVHILKTCLGVFIDRESFLHLDLGPGKEAMKQYAAWYWQEHAAEVGKNLAILSRAEKRELGAKLHQMLTDEATIFDWSIMYAKEDEGLDVFTDSNIKALQSWFRDADVVDGLCPDAQAFAKHSSTRPWAVCEPTGRLYAKAWLSSGFTQYAPTLFCFKIVQTVAFMNAGYDWSHANLHWPDIAVEQRMFKATQWAAQPLTVHWHRRVGSTYLTLKLHGEALRHYDAALKMDKDSPETSSRIAYCKFKDGRYATALEQAMACAAIEERDLQQSGLSESTVKMMKWRLYRAYFIMAQCSYKIGQVDSALKIFEKAIEAVPEAELNKSEDLEAEIGYLEVLAAENMHKEMMELAKALSNQASRHEYVQNRFVDLLLKRHNTLLVLDWIPKAASKTGQLEFLLDRLEQAMAMAKASSDSLTMLYLRLALGAAYAYNRDIDVAIEVFEEISLPEARPRGTIATRQAHAVSFQKLASLYKQKALHAGLQGAEAEAWIGKLEDVQKRQQGHRNLDMPVDMLGSDVNVASIFLSCFYRLLGRTSEANALLQGLIRDSMVILSDSEPQNDVYALDNLLRIFIAANDVPNAQALARSMRKVNPEASISTPGDSPKDRRGAPKLPGIQSYDRCCFQCYDNVSASKEFFVCHFCMECFCTDCLDKVIRRAGNSTNDRNSKVVCRNDHKWFMVGPLNRVLHTGEIQLEDESVEGFAEWKETVRCAWGLDAGFTKRSSQTPDGSWPGGAT